MLNTNNIIPLFEAYIQERYDSDYDISNCSKNQIINNLQSGYIFVKNRYKPKGYNICCCNNQAGTPVPANKKMYIYMFEYAYQLQQGNVSLGSNIMQVENKNIDRQSVEVYVTALMDNEGDCDF